MCKDFSKNEQPILLGSNQNCKLTSEEIIYEYPELNEDEIIKIKENIFLISFLLYQTKNEEL
jgi:hypothetical protein